MTSQESFVWSMRSLLEQIDSGAIQDKALPGTSAAEATRLEKNGLSVAAYASFEHFVRGRIAELLSEISSSPDRPPFHDLPEKLQVAATQGVVDALRFRLNLLRSESLETSDIVELTCAHAGKVHSSLSTEYEFSDWSFGWSTSNISAGTLSDFLQAVNAPALFNEIESVLKELRFDFASAGLTENGNFRIKRFSSWRHGAAHDATLSIDVQLLRTRITAYLAIACTFDFLASLAVRILVDGFGPYGPVVPDRADVRLNELNYAGGDELEFHDGAAGQQRFYSVKHCQETLGSRSLPLSGLVVVRDLQQQLVDWFFY